MQTIKPIKPCNFLFTLLNNYIVFRKKRGIFENIVRQFDDNLRASIEGFMHHNQGEKPLATKDTKSKRALEL
jgi:hypothetical protein